MKIIYAVVTAVLLGIAAAWWFSVSEDKINAIPSPAVVNGFDDDKPLGGNAESPEQQGSRQPVTPSREATAGNDVGSGDAKEILTGNVAHSAPEIERAALRDAVETIPGRPADTTPSQ